MSDLSVLLVEDDKASKLILERMLKKMGFKIYVASDGLEALNQLRQNRDFSLLLTDAYLPHLSGVELLGAISAHPKLRQLPRILISADEKACQTAREFGFWGSLRKPIQFDALESLLRHPALHIF